MDGTEICLECNRVVKIGDCYGHARNCSELCRQCRKVNEMGIEDFHTWLNKWRDRNFTPDGALKPPWSLVILGIALLTGTFLAIYF